MPRLSLGSNNATVIREMQLHTDVEEGRQLRSQRSASRTVLWRLVFLIDPV